MPSRMTGIVLTTTTWMQNADEYATTDVTFSPDDVTRSGVDDVLKSASDDELLSSGDGVKLEGVVLISSVFQVVMGILILCTNSLVLFCLRKTVS